MTILKRFLLSLVLLIFSFSTGRAAEMVIAGTYQGKNLYVQNPFTGNLQDFCTLEVFINGTKANINLNSSAFEIDLSFLQMNEEVLVKIVYKDDCKPKILNSSVIKSNTHFHFVSFTVDEKQLSWATRGEKLPGKFFVEQFLHNTWVIKSEMDSKGGVGQHNYHFVESHHSGPNKYRIRFRETGGHFFYSKVIEFNSVKSPIAFSPKKVVNFINLSEHTHYEILDEGGVSLMKGSGVHISVSNLKPGEYYLNIDNRTEKFSKH